MQYCQIYPGSTHSILLSQIWSFILYQKGRTWQIRYYVVSISSELYIKKVLLSKYCNCAILISFEVSFSQFWAFPLSYRMLEVYDCWRFSPVFLHSGSCYPCRCLPLVPFSILNFASVEERSKSKFLRYIAEEGFCRSLDHCSIALVRLISNFLANSFEFEWIYLNLKVRREVVFCSFMLT